MSFAIVTDTSANLPAEYAREHGITIIPFSFYIDGEENTCTDAENFDGAAYYAMMREGKVVTSHTSPKSQKAFFGAKMAGNSVPLFAAYSA